MKNIILTFFQQGLLVLTLLTGISLLPLSAQQHYDFDCAEATWYPSGPSTNSVPFSYNGDIHTPKGNLHILIVFVRYNNGLGVPNPGWGTSWPDGPILPGFAVSSATGVNELFNEDPTTITTTNEKQNLSEYYYQMSGGKFRITADVYTEQVPINFIPLLPGGTNRFTRVDNMNRDAIDWIATDNPSFNWSKYDNRTNLPFYNTDNSTSSADGKIDYIVFMHRALGETGVGTPVQSDYTIPNTSFIVQNRGGHTMVTNKTDNKRIWNLFTHEFAHNLYSSAHYMGANGVIANKYTNQFGWGMMSRGAATFMTANAWERWWLDWYTPTTITSPGLYTLDDFMTTGEAIRIEIPNTNQYIWLENHQKISHWDQKAFYNDVSQGQPVIPMGIYGYVTFDGFDNRGSPFFFPSDADFGNGLQVLSAEGNWDMAPTNRLLSISGVFSGNPQTVYSRLDRINNPIAGNNSFRGIAFDGLSGSPSTGTIPINTDWNGSSGTERYNIFAEEINSVGNDVATYAVSGDGDDAFDVGDEIGLSGIFPVLNYPKFDNILEKNDPFILNGISIEIISKNAGVYTIEVKFDEYQIDQNTRWCGNIVVPDLGGDEIVLASNKELLVDLSGSHDRITPSSITNTFTNPTELTLQSGAKMLLKSQSDMIVQNHSIFRMKSGSILEVETGAELRIESTGSFIMEPGSMVEVHGNGEILIEPGGHYFFDETASLVLNDNSSCISIKGDWELGEDAVFTFTGNGFVYLGLPQTPGNVINNGPNPNGGIVLQGNGPTDKVLTIESNTYLYPEAFLSQFKILDGRVEMGDDANISLIDVAEIHLEHVDIRSILPQDQHDGIYIQTVQSIIELMTST